MCGCSGFPVIIMISFMPGFVGSELKLSRQGQTDSQLTKGLHGFRVKRGWIWDQLSVEEEDPTPKIIGQVKPEKSWEETFLRKCIVVCYKILL